MVPSVAKVRSGSRFTVQRLLWVRVRKKATLVLRVTRPVLGPRPAGRYASPLCCAVPAPQAYQPAPLRSAVPAPLRTSHAIHGVAFAACSSPRCRRSSRCDSPLVSLRAGRHVSVPAFAARGSPCGGSKIVPAIFVDVYRTTVTLPRPRRRGGLCEGVGGRADSEERGLRIVAWRRGSRDSGRSLGRKIGQEQSFGQMLDREDGLDRKNRPSAGT